MGKINIDELIEMLGVGTPQKDCAEYFKVSPAAISQTVQKIKLASERPPVFDRLTDKELKFSIEVAGGASRTHAAEVAFDTSSRESARSMGSNLMRNTDVQEAITAILESEGLSKRYLIRRLRSHADSNDAQASLKSIDLSLKLLGAFPETVKKSVNLNITCPVDLSAYSM